MAAPQCRQRPRSSSQLSSGTMSHAASGWWQCGQAERAATTGCPSGRRSTRVPRKLPIAGAATNIMTKAVSGMVRLIPRFGAWPHPAAAFLMTSA